MKIEILAKRSIDSVSLYENAARALLELGIKADIAALKDPETLNPYKDFPVLIVDGKIRSQGKTLSVEEIKQIFKSDK